MRCNICVVGAGVTGLSTAVNIIENLKGDDVSVHLIADKLSPDTTSDGSGGFWEPYLLGDTPIKEILKWGRATYEYMAKMSQLPSAADTGSLMIPGYTISTKKEEPPFWKDIVFGFREMTEKELNHFGSPHKFGFSFVSVVTECRKYLHWLMNRFTSQGGVVFKKHIQSLRELSDMYHIVVNCSGIGAYDLVGDDKVIPVRGQVIRVKAPWVKMFVISDSAYILPNADSVVLGGTLDSGQWEKNVSEKDKARIWQECVKLLPSLQKAEHISDWVGLRPSRSRVRLEAEEIALPNNKTLQVVHNYGHAGGGVTLHWGCALEATNLVHKAQQKMIMKQSKL